MNATSHMCIGIIGRTICTKFGTDTVSMKHIFFLVKKISLQDRRSNSCLVVILNDDIECYFT